MADEKFHPEEILKLEFEYASRTAEQAQDDRTAIVNLYLFLVGGVGSVIGALIQWRGVDELRLVFSFALALLGVIGFFMVFKLIRLRQSWHDSALTMNRIKDFYLERFPELAQAFRWRTETIPAEGKWWTISFNLAVLVAVIDSMALSIAVHLAEIHFGLVELAVEILVGFAFLVFQIWFYHFQLPKS